MSVDPPADSQVRRMYGSVDLLDAYQVLLPPDATGDPETLARFIFSNQARWTLGLMRLRDAVVRGFGLKTSDRLLQRAAGGRVGIFRIYDRSDAEIMLGEDDRHLDFRLSVMCRTTTTTAAGAQAGRFVVVSTVVHCHNRWGRLYIRLIAPFHRLIVRSVLRRAARSGWPARGVA